MISSEIVTLLYKIILSCSLAMIRISSVCATVAFLSKQFIGGLARNVVVFAISLIVIPIANPIIMTKNIDFILYITYIGKEAIIGFILGFLANFIFYVAQCSGFLIDTQRGSSMATVFDPMAEEQITVLGSMFLRMVITLFFTSGASLLFFGVVFKSYTVWPIDSFFPNFNMLFPKFFLNIVDDFTKEIVVFVGPLLFILFLAEFGLGMISRFAPQLNVFFLAMPVKSALAMFYLVLYNVFMIEYFKIKFIYDDKLALFFQSFFK